MRIFLGGGVVIGDEELVDGLDVAEFVKGD